MNAGRELDALVAEKVMGWRYNHCDGVQCPTCGYDGLYGSGKDYPGYSTDIAAAWTVVKSVTSFTQSLRADVKIENLAMSSCHPGHWSVTFSYIRGGRVTGLADTAPLAICLAALKAVGAK